MKLLIIRPEPGASASAKRAERAGFTPMLLPFFEVRPRVWTAPDPAAYDALLITSSNAIRHGGADLKKLLALPVYAVGERSAQAAQGKGFAVAASGDGKVETALNHSHAAGHRRILWLAGEDRRDPVIPEGQSIATATVYASIAVTLPGTARAIIAEADIIALHSPRAAILFGETVDHLQLDRSAIALVAFSPAIAEAAGPGWSGIAVAKMPEDSALLSAAAELVRVRDQPITKEETRL
jgi:uroporphyrinogen-III synthase